MKNYFFALTVFVCFYSCKMTRNTSPAEQVIVTYIDLVDVQDDRVSVSIDPGPFTTDQTIFYIPRTVPGTYSTSNYGKYSEDFRAIDYKGNELEAVRLDDNSWSIPNAKKLDKVIYRVNDTFDIPGEGGIYSMAGTNILQDENFLLNLHGFVGYFENMKEEKYRLEIKRPADLIAGSALTVSQTLAAEDADYKTDVFNLDRYFEVIDNPVMYASPDTTSFKVEGMEVLINVYSPNRKFSAEGIRPGMEKMITAQKAFLGDINSTNKYAILLYLSATPGENDAGNFGALEHHTSTVVVLPETMGVKALNESMKDIVAHEFFHILTPLSIHSKEIHFFDYNDPKMSQHLWMYEGVTEYFANLFQVNQGLIEKQDFYDRMVEKINLSKNYDDTMPFTVMSQNILEEPYQTNYTNVYQKGALIGMALDIRLRELSNGKMGLLNLMKKLAVKYGKEKPFDDQELIPVIVQFTYPEIQEFFDDYVKGSTPIPYADLFQKVGLEMRKDQIPVQHFLKDQATPYITVNSYGRILVRNDLELNSFLKDLGLKGGDVIKSINGVNYTRDNVYNLITDSQDWQEGEEITATVIRDSKEVSLRSRVVEPTAPGMRLMEKYNADSNQIELRYRWLKTRTNKGP